MLASGTCGEGQLVRQAHRLHRFEWGAEPALLALERLCELCENARLSEGCRKFAGPAQGTAVAQHAAGKIDRRGLKLAGDARIDQPEAARLGCLQLLGLGDHAQRCASTHQARQALRTARTWDDAELHLGQA